MQQDIPTNDEKNKNPKDNNNPSSSNMHKGTKDQTKANAPMNSPQKGTGRKVVRVKKTVVAKPKPTKDTASSQKQTAAAKKTAPTKGAMSTTKPSATSVAKTKSTSKPAPKAKPAASAKAKAKPAASAKAKAKPVASAKAKAKASSNAPTKAKQNPSSAGSAKGVLATIRSKLTPGRVVATVCAVLYLAGTVYFSFHFTPGTKVNGNDVSWDSVSAVKSMAQNEANIYHTSVSGEGLSLDVSGEDIDLAFNPDAFGKALKQSVSSWAWLAHLVKPQNIEVSKGISFDEDKLDTMVAGIVEEHNQDATEPSSARIVYDQKTGSFEAVKETMGTAIDPNSVTKAISHGIGTLREDINLDEAVLLQPPVSTQSPSFVEAMAQANELAHTPLDITVADEVVYTVEEDLLGSWIYISSDYQVFANLEKIQEWTRGPLSSQLNTVGTTRTYTRPDDGKEVEVSGGTYGWAIDAEQVAQDICRQIESNAMKPVEVTMQSTAQRWMPGGLDWNNRFIDVDLIEQYVRMYDDNSNLIWSSECVTGDYSTANGTVTGVYTIYGMMNDTTLVGMDYDGDGQPDYESDVSFWMPFFEGYGFHDALWRSYFGGDAYLYDGSHGCVNLPYDAAASLFDIVQIGDVVSVHL